MESTYSHSSKSQVKITKYINKIMMLMMTEVLILAFFCIKAVYLLLLNLSMECKAGVLLTC